MVIKRIKYKLKISKTRSKYKIKTYEFQNTMFSNIVLLNYILGRYSLPTSKLNQEYCT